MFFLLSFFLCLPKKKMRRNNEKILRRSELLILLIVQKSKKKMPCTFYKTFVQKNSMEAVLHLSTEENYGHQPQHVGYVFKPRTRSNKLSSTKEYGKTFIGLKN